MDIKAIADNVAVKYGTRDPVCIAKDLEAVLIYAPLCEVRGMRQYINRSMIIYINSDLDERQQQLVCAHELGHHFLHRGMNRLFMDRKTCMVPGKYENQADRFAVDLIFDDSDLCEYLGCPVQEIADMLGISYDLAEYRMRNVNPRLF